MTEGAFTLPVNTISFHELSPGYRTSRRSPELPTSISENISTLYQLAPESGTVNSSHTLDIVFSTGSLLHRRATTKLSHVQTGHRTLEMVSREEF